MIGSDLQARRIPPGDVVLAVTLAAFMNVGTFFASHQHAARRPYDGGAVALILIAAAALAFRRRYPVPVLAVVFGTLILYYLLGYANGPIWLALIVAFYTATVLGHRLAVAVVGIAGFGLFPWVVYRFSNGAPPSLASMSAVAAWILVLFGAGEAVRFRRERAAEARRIREEEERRRAGEERLRIARELHDALGHHLSLISVQSGVALHLNEELPEEARSSLVAIKQASKEALSELRSVLDVLRQEGEPAPRSPGSTLARLDDLVSQASAAGLEVRTETEGPVRPLPFAVDVAAFRIVQEALTNVTRHSGAAAATVHVSYSDRNVTVQIDDDGRGSGSHTQGGGTGISGMRARVNALGGELQAGPRPQGGFRVRARLPLDGAS
jgi:signal transduction histidine kinase